ncbi:DUF4440 domain-containing protein [Verticiella sediminum]|uniref:DUF4440 domain-containing protein n=1 Tax=Verticiella sediminum TaxID=1247510 RepID=A0A556AJF6_9BURK|nr:nuclear transport factor 2 family protein [Verticiella sediminum]TSH93000.1 DUF4440 domain-containing protein [Verticiella sediminum]
MQNPVQALVLDFFHALDRRDHAGAAALFAPAGTWLRQGRLLTGPDEALAALDARPANRSTCHLVSNMRIRQTSETQWLATYYLTAFEALAGDDGAAGEPRLAAILECTDVLDCQDGSWRIADKRSRRALSATPPTR